MTEHMDWTWTYETADGQPKATELAAEAGFASQHDAESWLGEVYPELLADGVDQVSLFNAGALVYGPMSLHPVQQ